MKQVLLLFLLSLVFKFSFAQAPFIEWQKCLGGNNTDWAYSTQPTSDGGFILAGESRSLNGNVNGNHGNYDCWIVKLNHSGIMQWQKCLGGSWDDYAYSIQQTADGGYVIAGSTYSNDGNVSGNHDSTGFTADFWVVKLDNFGNIQWQKTLGGSLDDWGYSIEQTTDGGYIIAGNTTSNDGDVNGNHDITGNYYDFWIVKLTATGNLQWQKCFGGSWHEYANSVQQTSDGGYVITGSTESNDGDVSNNYGNEDCWLIKLDSLGSLQWEKNLGGSSNDFAYEVHQTFENGFILAGNTSSNDYDVSGNNGYFDYWVVKLNAVGSVEWQKCLGGTFGDFVYSIEQTGDTGFVMAGWTFSNDGDVNGSNGNWDYWVVKLDGYGIMQWQKCLGGPGDDLAQSIKPTNDGGYIVAGQTRSTNGNVTGNHGDADFWVVKLSYLTALNELDDENMQLSLFPNPSSSILNISSQLQLLRDGEITIHSFTGSLMYKTTEEQEQYRIDISQFASGIYFVTFTDKYLKKTIRRFVKL